MELAPIELPVADTSASRDTTAEKLLRRVEWKVLRRLDGILQGEYRSLLRGFGLDLADIREYQAGDDVRFIDWNVTARLDAPYIREFLEERAINAWFFLDLSRSMDLGSQNRTKFQVALEMIALLSRLLMRHGNRVGAVVLRDGDPATGRLDLVLPPKHGRRQVLQMLASIQRLSLNNSKQTDLPGSETNLTQFLQGAGKNLKRRSLVFVVSDFISHAGWGKALSQITRRHEVLAIRVFDPVEQALPDLGYIQIQDSETGELIDIDSSNPQLRSRYEACVQERESQLLDTLTQAGCDCLAVGTEDDLVDAIVNYCHMRRRVN